MYVPYKSGTIKMEIAFQHNKIFASIVAMKKYTKKHKHPNFLMQFAAEILTVKLS